MSQCRSSCRADNLPSLVACFQRHPAITRVEIDPTLSSSLCGPFPDIASLLAHLINASAARQQPCIAVYADVVADEVHGQRIHVTLTSPAELSPREWSRATAMARRIPAMLFHETNDDGSRHIILELNLPFGTHGVDIDTLRASLGSQEALHSMVHLLDETLGRDLYALDALLDAPGGAALQAWLHRVAGVLGLAEATSLANTGLGLEERLLAHGRDAQLDDAIRRFGDDAGRLLGVLRTTVDPLRL